MSDAKAVALRALQSLDLTNLNDGCTPDDIEALCNRAITPHGSVAAICIWPQFVAQGKDLVGHRGIKIATVVNFPGGDQPAGEVIAMTEKAVSDGADEIDMVVPYRDFLEGLEEKVISRIRRVKQAAGFGVRVKAILETGILDEADKIRRASDLAIEAGADFIKTSTGKVPVNATLSSARIMLEAIRDSGAQVGFKPAGGVRNTTQAGHYLSLADEVMGEGWATPVTFRFGASGVLDDLLAVLNDKTAPTEQAGY